MALVSPRASWDTTRVTTENPNPMTLNSTETDLAPTVARGVVPPGEGAVPEVGDAHGGPDREGASHRRVHDGERVGRAQQVEDRDVDDVPGTTHRGEGEHLAGE